MNPLKNRVIRALPNALRALAVGGLSPAVLALLVYCCLKRDAFVTHMFHVSLQISLDIGLVFAILMFLYGVIMPPKSGRD